MASIWDKKGHVGARLAFSISKIDNINKKDNIKTLSKH